MVYKRPKSPHQLTPVEKRELLLEYFQHYRQIATKKPELLNSKLRRDAFDDLLHEIGELIVARSEELATGDNEVSEFLAENPLPQHLELYLPKNYRVFCLALNALKQWLSAEQAATDRFIFGGTVRQQCRGLSDKCLVSGTPATDCVIELHHPVRDGRPPIPLAKEVHAEIEGQSSARMGGDKFMEVIYPIKKAGNRSWVMLKLGCQLLLGIACTTRSINVQASSKTFARKASEATGLTYHEILNWIEVNGLVEQ